MICIAVPLRGAGTDVDGGVSLVVATAVMRTYDLHELARQAEEENVDYDAQNDEVELNIESYFVVYEPDGRHEGGRLLLAAVLDSPAESIAAVKASIGAFARDVEPLACTAGVDTTGCVCDLGPESMVVLADEIGARLPDDWMKRFRSLSLKHMPPPIVARRAPVARTLRSRVVTRALSSQGPP